MISCREIAALPALKKLTLAAGSAGLDRWVRWAHFLDLPDVVPWAQSGELLILSGIGLHGHIDNLEEIVQGIIEKELAGLIVNIGPYISKLPARVLHLADQASFPLFYLPWGEKPAQVAATICQHIVKKQTEEQSAQDILEQLLFQPAPDLNAISKRAAYYGYNLINPHQIALLHPAHLFRVVPKSSPQSEQEAMSLKFRFAQTALDALDSCGLKVLCTLLLDDMLLLMPHEDDSCTQRNTEILATVLAKLADKIPGLAVTAGVGNRFECLQDARKSYQQAVKALHFGARLPSCTPICAYEHLGIYKLLCELAPEKLEAYYLEIIQPLKDYEHLQSIELVDTLFVYFEENCSAAKAARRLSVHRNTLDYRLKRISEISGKSLNNPYDRLSLQLGTIIAKQLYT